MRRELIPVFRQAAGHREIAFCPHGWLDQWRLRAVGQVILRIDAHPTERQGKEAIPRIPGHTAVVGVDDARQLLGWVGGKLLQNEDHIAWVVDDAHIPITAIIQVRKTDDGHHEAMRGQML